MRLIICFLFVILLSPPVKNVDILYFTASWCVPCKHMKPVIDSLEKDFSVRRIDIDEEKEFTKQVGVTKVPTIIIFKNMVEQHRFVGTTTEQKIREKLK